MPIPARLSQTVDLRSTREPPTLVAPSHDLIRERLATLLVSDGPLAEIVHMVLAIYCAVLMWNTTPRDLVTGWVSAIVMAGGLRYFLRRSAFRSSHRAAHLPMVQVGTGVLTLAWAAGLLAMGRDLAVEPLALIMVMLAGIMSGALVTLLSDPLSFALLATGLLGSLCILIVVNPHVHSTIGIVMLGTYSVAIAMFYRRSRRTLVDRIRDAIQLERATAEAQEAREAERHLARIVEATPDHIGIADADGRLRYMNRAGREMIGIGANENIARYTAFDLTPPRLHEFAAGTIKPIADATGSWSGESALQHRDGREVPVSLVAMTHRNEQGEIESISAVARDIAQEKALRESMRVAREAAEQATLAKSAFLANTSHEIRTPLNGILGMVELLLDTELTPSQRRSVELIASSGETLLHTINDLLDFSKIEAGQLEVEVIPFDLHLLLNSTVRLFVPRASAKGLELVCDIADRVPQHVRGDPHRLRQVFNNLLSNAIKFTEKGEVVLYAKPERDGPEPLVSFGVRDTGIGIKAEQVERVFEAFRQADASTTRRYGGTGLGLSIARRLVDLMGAPGSLVVESTPGSGSDFHFALTLPRATDAGAEVLPERSLQGVTVLVVDDHPTNRRVLVDMLRWAGGSVDDAPSVSDALARMRKAVTRGTPYRLVVSDVQMPDRDGFGLAEDVRDDATLRGARVMLLTSAAQRGDQERCREVGVRAYLQKPVSRVELIDAALATLGNTPAATPSLVTRSTMDVTRRRMRVLLAEDNPVNQEVAIAMLRKRGHDVVLANNGREAVQAANRDAFDVVLMDLQMPEMDGLEATQEIRASHAELPIIALTANTSPGERERCLAAGMNGYLAKPFKPHELFAIVEGWAPKDAPVAHTDNHGAPPVDLVSFREMLAAAGIPETGPRMLSVFLDDAPLRMQEMADAAQASDLGTIERVAHRLKSGASSICALGLADLLRRAESSARDRDVEDAVSAVRASEREFARVVDFLQATGATQADA